MAGWLAIADDSVRDCAKSPERHVLNRVLVDLKPPSSGSVLELHIDKDKLRRLFDRILPSLLERICGPHALWPLPPLLGDGLAVDLFRLFLVVIKKGGYDTVSENGLWGLVAKESGLSLNAASAVKLVYIKYLDPLQRLLDVSVENNLSKSQLSDAASNLDGFLMDIGCEFWEFLSEITGSKKKDEEAMNFNSKWVSNLEDSGKGILSTEVALDEGGKSSYEEESMQIDSGNSIEFLETTKLGSDDELKSTIVDSDGYKKCLNVGGTPFLDSSKCGFNSFDFGRVAKEDVAGSMLNELDGSNDDIEILDPKDIKENFFGCKRRRISFCQMLKWLIGVAKDPCSPVVVSLPECSKWESYGKEELWKQVLCAREALLLKRTLDTNVRRSIWQKNQKMHPSLYDDHIGSYYNLRVGLTCRGELSGKALSNGKPCSLSSSPDLDMGRSSGSGRMENHGEKETSRSKRSVFDYMEQVEVLLGSNYQVEVPEWDGVAFESDLRWLGTQIWPLEREKRMIPIERDRIGKGRLDSCGCQVQDSIECVRFHIAEKTLRLKLELGSAYYDWNIDKMGEIVALSWTKEEEKNFNAIVGSDPHGHCFRDEVFNSFCMKSRKSMVSYYFNVVLLQRRAHQNRFTPNYINSDDDEAGSESESESESVNDPVRYGTIKKPSSLLCSPGKAHKKSRH